MPSRILVPLAALLALSSCAAQGGTPQPAPAPASSSPPPTTSGSAPPDPAEVGANELGSVPVLMYHRIVAKPESVYDRTPDGFRAELERLAEEGYVPVTAGRFAAGDLDVPAGAHPVVLTFDDADPSQFALTEAGEPKPGTAVSIMQEVAERHPEFRPVATFFVNADPFGDPGGRRTLPWLLEHGMEIGNHTATHANLGESTPDQVRREIVELDRLVREVGGEPSTLALPFGIQPEPPELALHGEGYRYRGAFLVGANPSPSPYSAEFEPSGIPRIRSQSGTGPEAEVCSTVWLDKLAASPSLRYVSDGVPDRISFPRASTETVAPGLRERARPY
ncbi:polysaccharide deacetylase family protein [Actinophytocola gossypii]|uniref:polysaccharide deacetylase family protein n=1 Tax=Actinophytocola gossypii TaxID=2812003 RepID=UPI0021A33C8D|nr:polysaccharide deacetylase family protein [Actinophytocola gossypii]